MNIDWSKAPEGATHYAEVAIGRVCWYMVKSEYKYAYAYQGEGFSCERWTESGGAPSHQPLIERPKKQEAWDGVGLPPVGTTCEVIDGDFNCWDVVCVYVHTEFKGDTYACAKNESHMFYGIAKDFRPIKTAEQLAEEEREKAISDLVRIIDGAAAEDKTIAQEIYDAGYRKQ